MTGFFIIILPTFLLVLPLWFQVKFGKRTLYQQKIGKFLLVTLGSILLEIAMTFLGLIISLEGQQMKGFKNLSPGFISFGFFAGIILLVVIIVQVVVYKTMKN